MHRGLAEPVATVPSIDRSEPQRFQHQRLRFRERHHRSGEFLFRPTLQQFQRIDRGPASNALLRPLDSLLLRHYDVRILFRNTCVGDYVLLFQSHRSTDAGVKSSGTTEEKTRENVQKSHANGVGRDNLLHSVLDAVLDPILGRHLRERPPKRRAEDLLQRHPSFALFELRHQSDFVQSDD